MAGFAPSPNLVFHHARPRRSTFTTATARAKKTVSGTATYYVGNWYEVTNGVVTKYYYFGAQRVAMKQGSTVTYLHGDHLGSTSVASTQTGTMASRQTYYAFGVPRTTEGTLPTDYTFTGQKNDASSALMFYNARYYDAAIGRFTQPDSIIPDQFNPQSLNRYAYTLNNPVNYVDPTGHAWCDDHVCQGDDTNASRSGRWLPYSGEFEKELGSLRMIRIPLSPADGDPSNPWEVGWEWLIGDPRRHHEFRAGDPFLEMLRTHKHIAEVLKIMTERLRNEKYRPFKDPYDLSGLEGIPKYFEDYTNLLTGGRTGNLAVTYLGSYDLIVYIESVDPDSAVAQVMINATNESNLGSLTHPPFFGYLEFWQKNIAPMMTDLRQSGPMSPATQSFWWREKIHYR